MLKFLADENFSGHIFNALIHAEPPLDLVRVQDVGLEATEDAKILQWAAVQDRLVLTHDVSTMPHDALIRTKANLAMSGVVIVSALAPIKEIVENVMLLAHCTLGDELEGQIVFVPLR